MKWLYRWFTMTWNVWMTQKWAIIYDILPVLNVVMVCLLQTYSNKINYLYIYSGEWTCRKLFPLRSLQRLRYRVCLIECTLFPTLSRPHSQQLETTSFFKNRIHRSLSLPLFCLTHPDVSLSLTVRHIQMLPSRVLLNVPVTMHSQLKQKRSDTRVYRFLLQYTANYWPAIISFAKYLMKYNLLDSLSYVRFRW